MKKIKFNYDSMKDAEIITHIVRHKKIYGVNYGYMTGFLPKNVLENIKKLDKKKAVTYTEKYLKSNTNNYSAYVANFKYSISNIWNEIEGNYFNKLEKVTAKKFKFSKLICYITTGVMCPYNYNEKWFAISIKHPLPNTIVTIMHEILHFHIQSYYEIDNNLEEALLTVILNDNEFKNLILVPDQGYQQHRDSREKLSQLWKERKNFDQFIEDAKQIEN